MMQEQAKSISVEVIYALREKAERVPVKLPEGSTVAQAIEFSGLLQRFPEIELFTVEEAFGGWRKAQPRHFDDGGVFDQIYKP